MQKRNESQANVDKIRRKLWIIDGFLAHYYNLETLKFVSLKYERLDLVPEGYRFPEFFLKRIRVP